MSDIPDGGQLEVQGSGANPWVLRNVGGVYSCNCPAWRNQSVPIERRTCKHLKQVRGDQAEQDRVGFSGAAGPPKAASVAKLGAPPLLLAHSWENGTDLTGWWMSEKLDGVRAYWNGERFLSRLGNEYFAPAWFTAGLPATALDGELWAGRKQFQKTVSIARRQDLGHGWKDLEYVVFDAPAHAALFEERLEFARQAIAAANNPKLRFHPQQRCTGTAHLKQELARVESLGGEGLMMRRPGSKYEIGRSSTLLKVKTFKDAEAKVLGQVEGAGKFLGMMGALECQLADGTKFSVGTGFSDDERRKGFPPGTLITFRYQELSKDGVPRFPSFVGLRTDDVKFVAPVPAAVSGSGSGPGSGSGSGTGTGTGVASEPDESSGGKENRRRFERMMSTGGKQQFWEIELKGNVYRVSFGVVGGPTHRRRKRFTNAWLAAEEALAKVAEKIGRGYAEVPN